MKSFLLITFLTCCAFSTLETFAQGNKDVSLVATRNKPFSIKVPANPSTGYEWVLLDSLDKKFLKSVSHSYKANPQTAGYVGGGGSQVFLFKALRKGAAKIHLVYLRPWEKEIPADADKRNYKIRII